MLEKKEEKFILCDVLSCKEKLFCYLKIGVLIMIISGVLLNFSFVVSWRFWLILNLYYFICSCEDFLKENLREKFQYIYSNWDQYHLFLKPLKFSLGIRGWEKNYVNSIMLSQNWNCRSSYGIVEFAFVILHDVNLFYQL